MNEHKSPGAPAPADRAVAAPTTDGGADAPVPREQAVYTLFILILISAFNYFDRALLGLMAPLIRRDIVISDTTYGLISGFAFVLFYAMLGVPIAALADKVSRRNVIAVGFTLWTIMTAATGLVTSAFQLAVTRFLIGAGEACGSAPSNAMINDMFTQRTRARALAVYFAVSSAASSIIFVPLAGIVSAHYGWRAVFFASGAVGLLLALLLVTTVKEPPRHAPVADKGSAVPEKRALFDFGFIGLPFILLVCSSALHGAHLNAAGAWNAIFLNRVHGLNVQEITVMLGPLRGVGTAFGVLLGGYLTDRLGRIDSRWLLWLPALASFLVTPSSLLFLLGDERWIWMTGIVLDSILLLMHVAPVYGLAMDIAGPQRKALALSILMLSSSLIGSGMGPLLVGYLNDHVMVGMGTNAVRYSLLVAAAFPALSALMLIGSGHFIEKERRRREAIAA